MLCTSGFTDDVMFSYHGPMGRIKEDVMFTRSLPDGSTIPVVRQTTTMLYTIDFLDELVISN